MQRFVSNPHATDSLYLVYSSMQAQSKPATDPFMPMITNYESLTSNIPTLYQTLDMTPCRVQIQDVTLTGDGEKRYFQSNAREKTNQKVTLR